MRLSIGKVSGIKMLTPCHEDLVVMAANGVRSGRRLNKWLVLLFRLKFHLPGVTTLLRQTGSPHVEQDGAELSSAATEHCAPTDELSTRCNTIKLEPTWTREYLRDQQEADLSLKVVLQFKKAGAVRPKWEDVSPCDRTVKSLWAQWDQLEIHDRVLCRRWEEESGARVSYQIILP